MRKPVLTALSLMLPLVLAPVSGWAKGDATKFIVTVKEVKLKNAAGDWITLDDSSHEADLQAAVPWLPRPANCRPAFTPT